MKCSSVVVQQELYSTLFASRALLVLGGCQALMSLGVIASLSKCSAASLRLAHEEGRAWLCQYNMSPLKDPCDFECSTLAGLTSMENKFWWTCYKAVYDGQDMICVAC